MVAGTFELKDVAVAYGGETAVADVSLSIPGKQVLALIGPSGCGKSTVLRCLNRMNDEMGNASVSGTITLDERDIYAKDFHTAELRMRVGQVFQKANPFPLSIYENVAFGPRTKGITKKSDLDDLVEESLTRAALWQDVKGTLKKNAFELSGGQQQRLCIARALATRPEVLLMDEPCSALDPISTQMVEQTILTLKKYVTIVIVTHSMSQARRVSDRTAFMLRESSEKPATLVEVGDTQTMFESPSDPRTASYIGGSFG